VGEAENKGGVRVLIVDDHQLFSDGLRALLEGDGRFEVIGTASSGREAMHTARSTSVDVVLMDMSMPVLDGLATTRRLLALDQAPHVIAVSGHTDSLSRAAALEAGAAAFLSKADAHSELVDVILDVCASRD
jgi:DNA-binding NarL/FixJ family response regulator